MNSDHRAGMVGLSSTVIAQAMDSPFVAKLLASVLIAVIATTISKLIEWQFDKNTKKGSK